MKQRVLRKKTSEEEFNKVISRTAGAIVDDIDVMAFALKEKGAEALELVSNLESQNPYLKGVTELFTAHPRTYCWGTNRNSNNYNAIPKASPHLLKQLNRLTQLRDANLALIITGLENDKPWRIKEVMQKGYTPKTFDTQLVTFQGRLAMLDTRVSLGEMCITLKDVTGIFDYKNKILVITEDKNVVLEHFLKRYEDNGYLDSRLGDGSKYFAEPGKFVSNGTALINPPTTVELKAIDEIVRAYERKLIRIGCVPNYYERGGGWNLLMHGVSGFLYEKCGFERTRRPEMTYKKDRIDTKLIKNQDLWDIRMHDVEGAVRTLYAANKVVEHLEKCGMLAS